MEDANEAQGSGVAQPAAAWIVGGDMNLSHSQLVSLCSSFVKPFQAMLLQERHATNKGRAKVGYCNFPRDCFGVSSGMGRGPFPPLCVRCAGHGFGYWRFGGNGWRFAGSSGDAAQLAARKSRTNAFLQRRVGAPNCDAFAPSTEERGAACGSCSARGDAAR